MLKDNYEFVNDLASQVQKSIDSKAKIQLNPQKAIYPIERINQVISAVSDVKAEWETIQCRLDSPVCTVTESFYDDYVKENAKFRNDLGLNCYITRTASANCCKWCSSLAGRYAYSDAPPDIYRRHDNCTCTVTFENGKTRQDVWSKKTWEVKETPKESYKPKKFSNEQAKAVQQENLQYKGIDNSKKFSLTNFLNDDKIINKEVSFKERLAKGEVNTTIEKSQQQKHQATKAWKNQVKQAVLSGYKQTPKSLLDKNINSQEFVDKYAGTGIIQFVKNNAVVHEYISVPNIVGRTFDKQIKKYVKTNVIQIKYTENGIHIFPTKRSENK